MNVCEESHSGGVEPMNHSNKDTRSSAESGEGRPLIKENAGQPNTYPTQSGKGVSQGLAGVRKAARVLGAVKDWAILADQKGPNRYNAMATRMSPAPTEF